MSDLAARLRAALAGRYTVGEQIGRGGMATVYTAEDLKHNRTVAIKVLRPELAAALGTERFLREIQIAARLRHPHIIPLFDSGDVAATAAEPPVLYYIMPRIEGESLRALLEREGALPVPVAVKIAAEVAEALDHAHAAGVVHRDIKPENILLEGGHALVADFGISRALGALRDQEAAGNLTETGHTIGTPAYMSPEQIEGRPDVDGKSDLYSLACVTYEMLAGKAPYLGPSPTAIAARHLMDPVPSLRVARPEISAPIDTAIQAGMAKDPARRQRSARAFGTALQQGESGPSPAVSPPRSRALTLVAVVLLVLLGAYLVVVRLMPASASPLNASTVAVMPFAVQGQDTLHLGEGMVTLLSTKMDGAGDLRTVDTRALLSYLKQMEAGPLDPAEARRVAQRFSAGMFVLGDVVAVGPRVQITARLYGHDSDRPALLATEEGDVSMVFELVDRLAARLLAERAGSAAGRLAGVTTSSLPAFKAYLDGESAMRTGRFDEAMAAYTRATAADSNFALAWYRMSVAAQWLTRDDIVRDAAVRAERLSTELPERFRQLLQATTAGTIGDLATAERIFRGILGTYPDDIEAWMQLAELLFHTGPVHGRDFRESRPAWMRVVSFEPDNLIPLIHLARMAAADNDTAGLDTLVAKVKRIRAASGQTVAAARAEEQELAMLQAVVHRDTAAMRQVLDSLRLGTSLTVAITVLDVASYAEDLPAGLAVVALLTSPSRNPVIRANGFLMASAVHLGMGKWAAARRDLDSARTLDPGLATAYDAYFQAAPFVQSPAESLAAARPRLSAIAAPGIEPPADASIQFTIHRDLYDHYRLYLQGLYAALARDYPAAARAADGLVALRSFGDQVKLARNLAAGIRAEIALGQGNPGEALRVLEGGDYRLSYLLQLSPFFSGPRERYLRADLLERQGRETEALHWFATLDDKAYLGLPYLTPSLIRRGRLLERLGRNDEARRDYRRAVALWNDPDPMFRPMLEEARAGLKRVGG